MAVALASSIAAGGSARPVRDALPQTPADLVDPRIGNAASRGNTVIGPSLPHGSIHPSPDTPGGGTSGYKTGQPVRGFSQMHVSGTGWSTYGNILFSPQVRLDVRPEGHDSPVTDEVATAYSYRARLSRYGVTAEVAPTHHAAMYRFTFPAGDQAHLMLDLAHQLPGQILKYQKGSVETSSIALAPNGRSVSGMARYTGGFGAGVYDVYFQAEIDTAPTAVGTFLNDDVGNGATRRSARADDRVGGWWRFAKAGARPVQVKIGISFRNIAAARAHLNREIPGWRFDAVRASARAAWNRALGRIAAIGGSPEQQRQFYTAMYHAQLMPRDRTGEFARFAPDAPMWDDQYAIWDTWRTKFPLMVMIDPAMVRGNIASFAERLRVDGQVRDSFVAAGVSATRPHADQGGNDIDNVIADAYVKGLKGVDWASAFRVLKHNADRERQGKTGSVGDRSRDNDTYRERGWLSPGIMNVSDTLEYAYNDFAAAQVARGLGHTADADRWTARARGWQALFNPQVEESGYRGFIVPRKDDGRWIAVDLIKYPGSWQPYFYEAASWGYSFFVPHQTARLITMMGGRDAFVRRLEHGLETRKVDFSNEPAFLAPTLFHYAGRPDLGAKWTARYADAMVDAKGYPGDDDSGAMSSYYVWASLGLFPNAGQDIYVLNGPRFDRIVIDRPDEGRLTVTRGGEGSYVAGVTLNGRALERSWLRHRELSRDARLHFTMARTPTRWGQATRPPSDDAVAAAPFGQVSQP
jgi:predicted alpha-1,2-mannosidase